MLIFNQWYNAKKETVKSRRSLKKVLLLLITRISQKHEYKNKIQKKLAEKNG